MTGIQLGRHVYGLAAIGFGLLGLSWRQFNIWQQIAPLGLVHHSEILLSLIAAIQIAGGIAIQFARTARAGAAALGIVYLFFALLWLPLYFAKPVYDSLGNFFEQFSPVSGAIIVYASSGAQSPKMARFARIGYYCFALSVVSFTLEQALYLHGTARFVPTWIPPGQMFWAITTTIAFALAAIALFIGRSALLASRLLTLMIGLFGLLIWLPAPFRHPELLTNWAGNAENWAIAGSAWIVTDYLAMLYACAGSSALPSRRRVTAS
ncbi:MAG TPA: hypothetical protein VGI19_03620 [Candidatus Cybelea sp.]|jgi:hypothetical protein